MKPHRLSEREPTAAPPQGPWSLRAVRVGIADDHPITRTALRCYLDEQDGIRVVAEAASGREAIDLVRTQEVDVLLLDLDMPGQSGIDALTMIKRLVNLGDAKSLACHPASTTHRQMSPDEQRKAGVTPETIRLSVGIEHIDDIIDDLDQALDAMDSVHQGAVA